MERSGSDDLTIYFKTNADNDDGELFDHMVLRFFCEDGDDYYPDDLDMDKIESDGTWTGCSGGLFGRCSSIRRCWWVFQWSVFQGR